MRAPVNVAVRSPVQVQVTVRGPVNVTVRAPVQVQVTVRGPVNVTVRAPVQVQVTVRAPVNVAVRSPVQVQVTVRALDFDEKTVKCRPRHVERMKLFRAACYEPTATCADFVRAWSMYQYMSSTLAFPRHEYPALQGYCGGCHLHAWHVMHAGPAASFLAQKCALKCTSKMHF